MNFDTIQDAKKIFMEYHPFKKDDFKGFWMHYDWDDWKFGDYILIQHVKGSSSVSRPIYGIFIDTGVWDQALVVHFIEKRRAWQIHNSIGKYNYCIALLDPEITTIQLWTDDIHVLGHWKLKPTIQQMKSALLLKI